MTSTSSQSSNDLSPGAEMTNRILRQLGQSATFLRLMGVNYIHLNTTDGGELFVTEHGLPFLDHVRPENWYEPQWFKNNRTPLQGTGTVYRVPTRPIPGRPVRSIDIVVKWCRVGQDVPLDTFTLSQAINAEFNTPFEEFSLVQELRAGHYGEQGLKILTQRPLAIFIPPEKMQLWQTGRSRNKILSKIRSHASVEIDVLRSYVMIYSWIKGIDAVQAARQSLFPSEKQDVALKNLTLRIQDEVEKKGFFVADHKPTHAIVHVKNGKLVRRKDGEVACGIVDYELLSRTEKHQEVHRIESRSRYLVLMRDRFTSSAEFPLPQQLQHARVLDVEYVTGRAQSTGGLVWVVGRDGRLFEYFLPERWRRKEFALSSSSRTWYTRAKDGVHLVWKVSRVGETPDGDPSDPKIHTLRNAGYNSPFEEFALALDIASKGMPTTLPRAIYVTGQNDVTSSAITDERRFHRMWDVCGPDGAQVLRRGPDYITIWGYFRGQEDRSAPDAEFLWTPIGAGQAFNKGMLGAQQLDELMRDHQARLASVGYEDLNLEPDHLLLTYVPGGDFQRTATGAIATRHCNFELVVPLRIVRSTPSSTES